MKQHILLCLLILLAGSVMAETNNETSSLPTTVNTQSMSTTNSAEVPSAKQQVQQRTKQTLKTWRETYGVLSTGTRPRSPYINPLTWWITDNFAISNFGGGYGELDGWFYDFNILFRIDTRIDTVNDVSKYLKYYNATGAFSTQGYGLGAEKILKSDWKLSGYVELMYYINTPQRAYPTIYDGFAIELGVNKYW